MHLPNGPAETSTRGSTSESKISFGRMDQFVLSSTLAFSGIDDWISLDFEWTCDEGNERLVHANEGEIIVLAFVVFDTTLGCDVCEGQFYCQPERIYRILH